MKCAWLPRVPQVLVRVWAPTADRDAVLMGDRFPGIRAACIYGRPTCTGSLYDKGSDGEAGEVPRRMALGDRQWGKHLVTRRHALAGCQLCAHKMRLSREGIGDVQGYRSSGRLLIVVGRQPNH